jgi:hypothetical protein
MPIEKTVDVADFTPENITVLKDLLDRITREAATQEALDAAVLWETNDSGDVALKTADTLDIAQKQVKQFVVENRTDDPSSPVTGQLWFRTNV